jgi:hypothetical protein
MTKQVNDTVVLDFTNIKTAGEILKKVNLLEAFTRRLRDAYMTNKEKPNHKFLVNFMYGVNGSSEIVSSEYIHTGSFQESLVFHLKKLDIRYIEEKDFSAEFIHSTLGYKIEEAFNDEQKMLIIKGSEIRYHDNSKSRNINWKNLNDDVQIIVTQLPLTKEDIEDAKQKHLSTVLGDIICKENVEQDGRVFTFQIK